MAQLNGMLIKKNLLFLLLATHFMFACSTLKESQHSPLAAAQGLAFFSMTISGYTDSEFKLTFVNELTEQEIKVELKTSDSEIGSDVIADDGFRSFFYPKGKLVELSLPEGIYRLKKWVANPDKRVTKESLNYSLNKKFKVMAGRELYLGNIHLHVMQKTHSLFIRDNRIRDVTLFYKKHDELEKSELLISSAAFLNPVANREYLFNAYANCSPDKYALFSKKRLPQNADKFRTLKFGSEEKKISRIDGYRLKYRDHSGHETLNIKAELSDARQYQQDKNIIRQWFGGFKPGGLFNVEFEQKAHFSELQLKNSFLSEKRMLYKVVMFDDDAQMIVTLVFINPPEFQRFYQTIEGFLPTAINAVNSYQQCVEKKLNHFGK